MFSFFFLLNCLSSISSQTYFLRFLKFCIFKILWNLTWDFNNFNMGVNGKHKMWNISKTAGRRAKLMKFGTRRPRNSLCRVLFGWGHLSPVWGHSMHFAKIPLLRFSKGYCSHSLHPISTKIYGNHGNHVGIQAISFSGYLPNFKRIWHFEDIKLPQLHCQYP